MVSTWPCSSFHKHWERLQQWTSPCHGDRWRSWWACARPTTPHHGPCNWRCAERSTSSRGGSYLRTHSHRTRLSSHQETGRWWFSPDCTASYLWSETFKFLSPVMGNLHHKQTKCHLSRWRPGHSHRVDALHKLSVSHHLPEVWRDPGHDPHAQNNIIWVSQLHTSFTKGSPYRSHAERDDIHDTSLHTSW